MIHIIHLAREEAQILEGCHFLAHPVELRTSTTVTRAFVRVPAPISQLNVTCSRQRMRWTDWLTDCTGRTPQSPTLGARYDVISSSVYQSISQPRPSSYQPRRRRLTSQLAGTLATMHGHPSMRLSADRPLNAAYRINVVWRKSNLDTRLP